MSSFAFDIITSVWSTVGILSSFAAFSDVRSTQIPSLSFIGFGTAVNLGHESVDWVVFDMTMFSILSSSSRVFSVRGRRTCIYVESCSSNNIRILICRVRYSTSACLCLFSALAAFLFPLSVWLLAFVFCPVCWIQSLMSSCVMNASALSPSCWHVKLSSFKNDIVFSVWLKCSFNCIIFLFLFISHWQVNSPYILQVFPFNPEEARNLSNHLIHLGHSDRFQKSICLSSPLFYVQENVYDPPLFLLLSPSCMYLARTCYLPHRLKQTLWYSLPSRAGIVHHCFLHLFSLLSCSPSVYSLRKTSVAYSRVEHRDFEFFFTLWHHV